MNKLGLVSSLINIVNGNNPNFSFDANGRVSFGNPELKELVATDYSKTAQSKFDSIASAQSYKETKIDNNITLVEKNNNQFAGEYRCDKIIDYGTAESISINASNDRCTESPNTKYGTSTNWHINSPITITTNGNNITLIIKSENYWYATIRDPLGRGQATTSEGHYERTCICTGTVNGNTATLTGQCSNKALMPMQYFHEGVDMNLNVIVKLEDEGTILQTITGSSTSLSFSNTSTSRLRKIK